MSERWVYLFKMYFKASGRTNTGAKKYDSYYRLVDIKCNKTCRICYRIVLNVGFLDGGLKPEQINLIARTLTHLFQYKKSIFSQTDPINSKWVTELCGEIVDNKVNQLNGRSKQKYPLAQGRYDIQLS